MFCHSYDRFLFSTVLPIIQLVVSFNSVFSSSENFFLCKKILCLVAGSVTVCLLTKVAILDPTDEPCGGLNIGLYYHARLSLK